MEDGTENPIRIVGLSEDYQDQNEIIIWVLLVRDFWFKMELESSWRKPLSIFQ